MPSWSLQAQAKKDPALCGAATLSKDSVATDLIRIFDVLESEIAKREIPLDVGVHVTLQENGHLTRVRSTSDDEGLEGESVQLSSSIDVPTDAPVAKMLPAPAATPSPKLQ